MELKTLNGTSYFNLVRAGAMNLRANYEEVDNLNVFPVPDGDTGTNMSRTITSGIDNVNKNPKEKIGEMGELLSKGMLMGARGNSGVILSQIFRGICKGFIGKDEITLKDLCKAYKIGVDQAYGAVVTPVEGTILTVYREATEYACSNVKEDSTINEFFELHLKQALVSLQKTQEILPVLKEAGVIDSGGAGYVYIVKGMVAYLEGKEIENKEDVSSNNESSTLVDFDAFTRDDVLKFGYCTEFILRLQTSKVENVDSFDVNIIIDYLANSDVKGDSIVALKDGDIIKTHVHTKNPGLVLTKMREYGEFLTLKIENMALQHNEGMSEEEREEKRQVVHKKYAIVAVAQGKGLEEQFKEFGVDEIVSGNNTMNPSTEDFISAFKKIDAEHIFVFPNNKNILMAAKQAASLYKAATIHVIHSVSIPQCFSALSMLDFSSDDVNLIIGNFNEQIHNVVTGEVTYAIRSTSVNGVKIEKNDFMAILNGKIVASNKDNIEIVNDMFKAIPNIDEKSLVVLIFGENTTSEEKSKLCDMLNQNYPMLEVATLDGGQAVYNYLISIE